ncbi:MAG: metallopeptidase family protein [Ignavibacteriae bacterium]|nr:metallopeptidase family protein [Ignavibacteria bacterium]MBI3365544.1 metallopeptidase family protein [Ignavibacteriota bacterium]
MDQETFEKIVERVFDRLPDKFREAIENVGVFTEDYPSEELVHKLHLPSKYHLLGLYQGVPLTLRGTWYGMTPIAPDKISLYKQNIEARSRTDEEVEQMIYEVLIHEIGHYFGMNEEEIRAAGY